MKFNLFEKKALLGMGALFFLFVISVLYIGKRNLWFEPKESFVTKVHDADGLHVGAVVTLAGLRVGDVTELKVADDNSIEVTFTVKKSLAGRITEHSLAKLHRMFLIGEKRIDLVPSNEGEKIGPGGLVKGMDSTELADMLSGKNMNSIVSRLSGLQKGMDNWAKSFIKLSETINPDDLVELYSLLIPTLKSVRKLTDEMTKVGSLSSEIEKNFISNKLAKGLVQKLDKTISPLAKRQGLIEQALDNVATLTQELSQYPDFAKDLIETLKETSTTLKALQKTWVLEDHVEEVKKEKRGKKSN